MDIGDNGFASLECMVISEGDRAAFGDNPYDEVLHGDWDLHNCVQ